MSSLLKPRETTVVLFQGDDFDALNQSLHEFANTAKQVVARLGDLDEVEEKQEAYNHLADEAEERAVSIRLRALPRKKWRELVATHPVRDGDEEDQAVGFNRDTLGDDLVPASIVGDLFPSIADRDEFLDSLADGDFERLYAAALDLNVSVGVDPKARLSSTRSPKSGETSSSPERVG